MKLRPRAEGGGGWGKATTSVSNSLALSGLVRVAPILKCYGFR